ncbi:MAG: right-handed parallel beta-helix repeat-containing protein [Planctomycetota bacterium]|jgi:hypothetical protein
MSHPSTLLASACVLVSVLLAPPLAAQITVGPSGSGAQFEQIDDAIAAASPGASIHVFAGEYDAFLVDKPLTLVGFGGSGAGSVIVHPDLAQELSAIRVAGIAAGEVVRITGIDVTTTVATPYARIRLESSEGVILLVSVNARGTDFAVPGSSSDASLVIEDCDAVVLESCDIFGTVAPSSQPLLNGAIGTRIVNSSVWINSSEVRGAYGGSQFGNGGPGASALDLTDSFVQLSRTWVRGGGGGVVWAFEPLLTYGFPGSPGAELLRSELVVAGGEGSLIEGGFGPTVSEDDWYPGGPAVRLHDDSTLRVASDAALQSGEDDNPSGSGPPIANSGSGTTVTLEPGPRPTLGAVPATVRPGEALVLDASGDAGALQLLYFSPLPASPVALGTASDLVLDPGQPIFLTALVLDGTGLASLGATAPADPGLIGLGAVLQSAQPGPALRLSNASALFFKP